jgi:hypothetical protein
MTALHVRSERQIEYKVKTPNDIRLHSSPNIIIIIASISFIHKHLHFETFSNDKKKLKMHREFSWE